MFISLFLCRFKVCECQTRSCKTGAGVSEHSPLIQTAVNVLLMLWTYCCVIWKMYITHPPCFVRIIHTIVIAVHLLMLMLCLKFVPQKNCALLAMLWISMSTGVQSGQIVQISALSDDDAGTAVHPQRNTSLQTALLSVQAAAAVGILGCSRCKQDWTVYIVCTTYKGQHPTTRIRYSVLVMFLTDIGYPVAYILKAGLSGNSKTIKFALLVELFAIFA